MPLVSDYFSAISGSIKSGNIGNAAVTSGNIASGSISIYHIASGVLQSGTTLSSGIVTSGYIGNNAVVSGSIASGSIGLYHIASGVLQSGITLSSGVVTSGYIGNNAIVSGSIASGSITGSHISSGSITNTNLASGTIIASRMASGSVLSGNIASGQIGTFHIGSGAITSSLISSGQIGSFHLSSGSVVSGRIASGQIGANHIASGVLFNVTNPEDNRIITSLASGTNQGNAEANLTFDGSTLTVTSTNLSGTLVNFTGVSGTLLRVIDSKIGDILQVNNSSGLAIFAVNQSNYTITTSAIYSGLASSTTIYSIPSSVSNGGYFNYSVRNITASGYRIGTVLANWDSDAGLVTYSDTSSADIGGSTIGVSFSAAIQSGNFNLTANIASGNSYNIKVGATLAP